MTASTDTPAETTAVDEPDTGKRAHPVWLWARKIVVTVAGFALLAVGVVMMVTPGPGLLGIVGGLALLATEYRWAKTALGRAKAKLSQAKAKVAEKKAARKARRVG